jgi:nitrogen PTS system EIIA component
VPPDDVPVTRLFFFMPPSPRAHLEILGRLTRALGVGPLRDRVIEGAPDEEILAALTVADMTPALRMNREVDS